jgi:FkbM family methyltransferase
MQPFGEFSPGPLRRAIIDVCKRTPLHRGLFRKHFTSLITAGGRKVVDVTYRGVRFRVCPEDNPIEAGILVNPKYNEPELKFLETHLGPDSVFIDIGANIGLFSLCMAPFAGLVIAIEPGKTALQRLQQNLWLNGFDNVTVIPSGVGDATGQTTLIQVAGNLGGAKTVDSDCGGEVVEVSPLAEILGKLQVSNIDALKIDIEGNEARALLPFFESAQRGLWPRAIVIEHLGQNDWGADVFETLRIKGYCVIGSTRSNTLLEVAQ